MAFCCMQSKIHSLYITYKVLSTSPLLHPAHSLLVRSIWSQLVGQSQITKLFLHLRAFAPGLSLNVTSPEKLS